MAVCPGHATGDVAASEGNVHPLLGPVIEVWQGHAADREIRFRGSSGGLVTALALFGIEHHGMGTALHTAMDPETPWLNKTVFSRNRGELLSAAGSRYATSSPCEGLGAVETSERPAVFIGKPCDAGAVAKARRVRTALDRKLGLVLSFFCAGTPSTAGTKELLARQAIPLEAIGSLRYRGDGWPGLFRATDAKGNELPGGLTYKESWHFLQKYRPFRCQLCPDGTGQFADISCGDAWHVAQGSENPGCSLAVVRTEHGRDVFRAALKAGYLEVSPASVDDVLAAQPGLMSKREHVFGRLRALRLLGIPAPRYDGFRLPEAWRQLPLSARCHVMAGTWKRILLRGLWHRRPVSP